MYDVPKLIAVGSAVDLIQHGAQGQKAGTGGDGQCDEQNNCALVEIDD